MSTNSKLEETWAVIPLESYPESLFGNHGEENPDYDRVRSWLLEQYLLQIGLKDKFSDDWNENFLKWLGWQEHRGDLWKILTIKHPHLTNVLFTQSASKYIMISQRHCHGCSRSLSREEQIPIKLIPLRIDPISWQASQPKLKEAFKKGIIARIGNISADFARTEAFCIGLTFCLNTAARDRDCDNMAKGVLDAVADTMQVNDRKFVHVDIVKLAFSDCEDSVTVRIAPSGLLKNTDVIVPETRVGWAGWERIELPGRNRPPKVQPS